MPLAIGCRSRLGGPPLMIPRWDVYRRRNCAWRSAASVSCASFTAKRSRSRPRARFVQSCWSIILSACCWLAGANCAAHFDISALTEFTAVRCWRRVSRAKAWCYVISGQSSASNFPSRHARRTPPTLSCNRTRSENRDMLGFPSANFWRSRLSEPLSVAALGF